MTRAFWMTPALRSGITKAMYALKLAFVVRKRECKTKKTNALFLKKQRLNEVSR